MNGPVAGGFRFPTFWILNSEYWIHQRNDCRVSQLKYRQACSDPQIVLTSSKGEPEEIAIAIIFPGPSMAMCRALRSGRSCHTAPSECPCVPYQAASQFRIRHDYRTLEDLETVAH